jgi:hypothetical protein
MGEGGHSNNIPCNKFSAEVSQNLLEPLSVSQWGLIKRGTTVTIYLVISFQQRILKIFQSLSKWFY